MVRSFTSTPLSDRRTITKNSFGSAQLECYSLLASEDFHPMCFSSLSGAEVTFGKTLTVTERTVAELKHMFVLSRSKQSK